MTSISTQTVVSAAALGVALHLGYFIRGEHALKAPSYLLIITFGPSLTATLLTAYNHASWLANFQVALILFTSLLGSITASILTYRVFFHPLKDYNGPLPARMSKLWQVGKSMRGELTYKILDDLHQQYGDYVRTGPNELSIIDSEIIEAVHGTQSKCIKTEWYDMNLPMTTLHQMRDRNMHDRRRKLAWDKAFNTSSLRAYDSRVLTFAEQLKNQIQSMANKPVNATKWFHYYGCDVMGSLGFGQSFKTLETGKSHFVLDVIQDGTMFLGLFGSAPWIMRLFVQMIPNAINPVTKIIKYSLDCVDQRRSLELNGSDIISHLIEKDTFFDEPDLDRMLLSGDSRLIIVAGSDTTSAALSYMFFYIAKDKSISEKIRAELKEHHIKDDDNFSIPALQNLHYLNGVINEALRLHPPVPGGVFRKTPPEGLHVGNRFIPGDVTILNPCYSLQRSPKNFAQPTTFIPERWTSRPDLILNKNTFMPFISGPYGCIGKQLAMNEMRVVVAKLVLAFDISLAEGETGFDLLNKDKDCFTVTPGKLELVFRERS